ncbi:MAG: hypothetical protein BRC58_02510 [Cyanobacteria bacterium QS_8_64_29]|nr:MAG: hypothetical protein BRC58_02510 [Cyanobacteria bacterium QS_8_64_29]
MNQGPETPQEQAPIQVSDRTDRLVEQNMPEATEQARAETKNLIETVTRKAQSEAQKAGELALDNYLEAIRRTRQEIESAELFDPDRIEQSFQLLQQDAQQNWESLVQEFNEFGDRLNEAARAAWDALTQPRSGS